MKNGFYLLHDKDIILPTNNDYKYIIYVKGGLDKIVTTVQMKDGIKYCPHNIDNISNWVWNDEEIDLLTHDNGIIAKFIKSKDYDNFQCWINNKFI